MATEPKAPAVEEVHILWISEGMSCDGDSVSITAAGQPSIEDVLLGAIPGCERAAEIGEVRTEPPGMVLVETAFGGRRVMDQLVGDPLPRIC